MPARSRVSRLTNRVRECEWWCVLFAIGLQQRRKAFALIAGACLVLAGVLGARHEANVAHVVDPITGELCHAASIDGTHRGGSSDYHGASRDHAGGDACAIAAAMRHVVDLRGVAATAVIASTRAFVVELRPIVPVLRARVLALAPKTSPPALA